MVKNINKEITNKKPGFSLFEACVTMLIVGIFTALCANTFSKRHVTYQESDGHGRYECYRNAAGNIAQRYVENNSPRDVAGTTCIFRPPRYAKYLLINMSGGGSGSAAGEFKSLFYSSIDAPLTITPGGSGQETSIFMNATKLYTVAGGTGELVATDSAADTVQSCTFTYNLHTCGSTPICSQDGSDLSISYCRSAMDFVTLKLPISYIKDYRSSYSGDTIVYRDISEYVAYGMPPEDAVKMLGTGDMPTYFTLNVKFNVTKSQSSQMEWYLDGLGINDGIATVNPGALNSPGGVVILW